METEIDLPLQNFDDHKRTLGRDSDGGTVSTLSQYGSGTDSIWGSSETKMQRVDDVV